MKMQTEILLNKTHKPFIVAKLGLNRRLRMALNEEPFERHESRAERAESMLKWQHVSLL